MLFNQRNGRLWPALGNAVRDSSDWILMDHKETELASWIFLFFQVWGSSLERNKANKNPPFSFLPREMTRGTLWCPSWLDDTEKIAQPCLMLCPRWPLLPHTLQAKRESYTEKNTSDIFFHKSEEKRLWASVCAWTVRAREFLWSSITETFQLFPRLFFITSGALFHLIEQSKEMEKKGKNSNTTIHTQQCPVSPPLSHLISTKGFHMWRGEKELVFFSNFLLLQQLQVLERISESLLVKSTNNWGKNPKNKKEEGE